MKALIEIRNRLEEHSILFALGGSGLLASLGRAVIELMGSFAILKPDGMGHGLRIDWET